MSFRDCKGRRHDYITVAEGNYYPDFLDLAVTKHTATLRRFGELLEAASDSSALLDSIAQEKGSARVQLMRVFRRYCAPNLPVEMLKKKSSASEIIKNYSNNFRNINEVRNAFKSRPPKDETIAALFYEAETRAERGYDLTELFFNWFNMTLLPHGFSIEGPRRSGRDIKIAELPTIPFDFKITRDTSLIALGLAHYDSDRGGGQEDDRTGHNSDVARQVLEAFDSAKCIFLNDGPGLTLGSMWDDYSALEDLNPERIIVVTLKMLNTRLIPWL